MTVQRAENERYERSEESVYLLGIDSKGISRPNKSRSQRLNEKQKPRKYLPSLKNRRLTSRKLSVRYSILSISNTNLDRNIVIDRRFYSLLVLFY